MIMGEHDKLARFLGFHELKSVKFYKAIVCEFVATAILLLFVSGTTVTMDTGKPLNTYTGAFNSAMAVAFIVWTFNHVSGAHINPVITLSFLVTGHVSLTKTLAYTVAQCAGAISGAALVWILVPPAWRGTMSSTTFADDVTVAQGFAVEAISTFTLVLGVFATSDQFRTDHAGSQALTVGLIVYIESAWAGKLTGCSMNPARTLGPAIMAGTWDNHWVYWVAPSVGAVAGALLYEHILAEAPIGGNIVIEVDPSRSSIVEITDHLKFRDHTIVVECNEDLDSVKEGFDNLAMDIDKTY
ncbi:unnamed protein product [Candidula unifasciata]|uniref:Aquaporin n=1 Tax=Candidula unifasciata TaxID=100452 RepID=A0A8S4A043_9EUPU|nr:unnamed protein product [Candidula unifasciata]